VACAFAAAIAAISVPGSGAINFSLARAEADEPEPGAYTWNPAPVPSVSMRMVINLRTQRGYVYRDGVRIGATPISSGKRGHRTPTGTFTVTEKQRVHHSNRYDNAPMPFMQRLTEYGIALHGGHVPGYPASHGCIRLPQSFARWLYGEPTMGMRVIITDHGTGEENAEEDTTVSGNDNARPASRISEASPGDRMVPPPRLDRWS